MLVAGVAGVADAAGALGVAGALGAGVDGEGEVAAGALTDGLVDGAGAGVAAAGGVAGVVAAGGLAGLLPLVDGPDWPANTK